MTQIFGTQVGRTDGAGFAIDRRGLLAAGGAAGLLGGLMPFAAAKAARAGGTLAMTINPEPNAMVSAFNTASPVAVISAKMTEGLLHYDFDLNAHPALATGWEMAEDGLSIRFDLRPGVKWHDGVDFTSADVAYSILQILRKHHPRGKSVFAKVTDVETPDALTAILRLSEPAPALMYALSGWESPIVPKHIYDGTDVLTNPANNAPVGTGPFKFVAWERGSHIILEANRDYWGSAAPVLDRLVVRIITDPSARVAAFEAGELHLGGDGPIPVSEVKRFTESPKFQVETRGTELNNSLDVVELNLRNEILAKPEVRQALMHALNRDLMMQVVYYGLAEQLTGPIPQSLPHLYTADVPAYPYDPDRARALLDAAGHAAGSDGMRFGLRLIAPAIGDTYDRAAQFMRQQFKAVGIDLELVSADVPTFIRSVYGEYDFDLSMFPASVTADPTIGSQRFYWSKAIAQGTPFVNASGYSSPEMDMLLEAAAVEPDPARRRQFFIEFQQRAMADLPILPLARPIYVTVASADVENFVVGPEGVRASYGSLAFA
ncbi:ABC transporter substrate-binding protein [Pseudodonghicola flavimaris]|uniref:ABC transporter substrate-binding protein n=1 Tax=Pseudodonghicola flavimaris TaxID=3050036 RepID=A0ABT7F2E7_9RHOB|nr:ABC transporter substrate-binding protein [Pseudodonghicola flavimaris]MDK3018768.1 ABC transporter substrate-binding protein [Pseudodonghicola flavimaris]